MAKTPMYDPATSEARSPWLSGLTEVCSKLSSVLDMETETFTDLVLPELFISDDDRCRIYQAPLGSKVWLATPAPIIKKNGVVIKPEVDNFSIDYLGGSIFFNTNNKPAITDVITASGTRIIDSSNRITELLSSVADLTERAGNYKGYFETVADLESAYTTAQNGDYALVGADKCFYIWSAADGKWSNTQSIIDLSNYYTVDEVDNLLGGKQATIEPHGSTVSSDNYYYGGRKTWQNIGAKVLGTVLANIDITDNEKISAADTVLAAIGKLQAQIDNKMHDIKGTGAPTTATKGLVGQDYINTSNGDKYHLVEIDTDGNYIWKQYGNVGEYPANIVTTDGGASIELAEGLSSGGYTLEITKEDDNEKEPIDNEPTRNSPNAVSSGGVYNTLQGYATKSYVSTELANNTVAVGEMVDEKLTDYITKTQVENQLSPIRTSISNLESSKADKTDLPDLSDYALKTDIPNVSTFITATTNDLVNYYNKTEADTRFATKEEVDNVATIAQFPFQQIFANQNVTVDLLGYADNNAQIAYYSVKSRSTGDEIQKIVISASIKITDINDMISSTSSGVNYTNAGIGRAITITSLAWPTAFLTNTISLGILKAEVCYKTNNGRLVNWFETVVPYNTIPANQKSFYGKLSSTDKTQEVPDDAEFWVFYN